MKKFYPATLCALFISFLSLSFFSSLAQTGGTYTAKLSGDWHAVGADVPIWQPSEPPMNCKNCLIILGNGISPTAVNLNVHMALTNNTVIQIGSGSVGTTLTIPNSGSADTTGSNSFDLISDGTNSQIQLVNNNSFVNVATNNNHAGDFDGLFTSVGSAAYKQVGFSPNGLYNGAVASSGPVANSSLSGPITLSANGTLPIILADFTATLNEGAVDLAWTTSLEINSDHFVVQRSVNAGASWDDLGTVAAHGASALPLNYTFTDSKPGQGTSEYRLILVDRDGKYSYSDVKTIRMGIVTSVSVYPNPARDNVNITLGGTANESMLIRLFNQMGQVLVEKNVSNAGGTTVTLAVGNYPEGNYIIVVTATDGSRQVSKLVITK